MGVKKSQNSVDVIHGPLPLKASSRNNDSRHAIVYLKDVDPRHMELLLSYMYRGEINVQARIQMLNQKRQKRVFNIYRVTRQLESYILLQSIWGVSPACWPLLQLATAQAGQGNSPN